ncbi:hypothetical protein CLM62_12695 [Streptomyces sp. SA15]|nr:hypothetical protein CLM62_12695 [Streptomyces sp. SA15]
MLHRLERAFLPLDLVRAVTRYEVATARKAELEAKPTREWSGTDFDSWVDCERTILDSVMVLVAAGRMDLLETPVDPVIRAAADFRKAALRAAALSNEALSPNMADLDADSLAAAEDLMAGARATLAAAGMLHLIGGGV